MHPAEAMRTIGAVLTSLALYIVGVFLAYQALAERESGQGMREWSGSTGTAFFAFAASYPLATLAMSIFIARRFGAPALSTTAVTGSAIAVLWLALWVTSWVAQL
ncbi:MAG: hypothetical protein WD939_01600 [Dehalococcoidia bacterium]